mmetsp:Transcript_2476/g.4139  ORF Transcript_2476/g.4139 Transcript_2476/m.4139 type:complete len:219 (-) Transcript_2476:62-718(-)
MRTKSFKKQFASWRWKDGLPSSTRGWRKMSFEVCFITSSSDRSWQSTGNFSNSICSYTRRTCTASSVIFLTPFLSTYGKYDSDSSMFSIRFLNLYLGVHSGIQSPSSCSGGLGSSKHGISQVIMTETCTPKVCVTVSTSKTRSIFMLTSTTRAVAVRGGDCRVKAYLSSSTTCTLSTKSDFLFCLLNLTLESRRPVGCDILFGDSVTLKLFYVYAHTV